MKKIIEQISDRFYKKLNQKNRYTFTDLSNLGFPDLLCESIQNTVHTKITRQLILPSDDWSYTEAEQVQQTKQLLLDALYNQAHVSANGAENVIREAITGMVKILIQPRKNIPEKLFGDKNSLAKEAVERKVAKLAVYRHFGRVLNSYLDRKKRSSLTRSQCSTIIANIDEKLTADYSPAQWAQLLEPLFVLTDGQINHNLLCLFFEDKQMPKKVQAFNQMNEPVDRQIFTEILSSAEAATADKTAQKDKRGNNTKPNQEVNFSPPSPVAESESNDKTPEIEDKKTDEKTEAKPENEATVNTKKSSSKDTNKTRSINDLFAAKTSRQEENVSQPDKTEITKQPSKNKSPDPAVPIWQRFTDDSNQTNVENKTSNGTKKNGATDKADKSRANQLRQQLSHKEKIYIDELFNGSKNKYHKNIAIIANATQWKEAINTIRDDIFEKNNVNIYSPTAIDFTDQLQKYFNEKR